MVDTWQILVAGGGILVTVLSVYGGLIKVVYDAVRELRQRFFGADTDDTDDGFVGDTKERLTHLEEGQRSIRNENRMQSRLMTSIAYGLEDLTAALSNSEEVDVDLDHVRVRDDFYRGGGVRAARQHRARGTGCKTFIPFVAVCQNAAWRD